MPPDHKVDVITRYLKAAEELDSAKAKACVTENFCVRLPERLPHGGWHSGPQTLDTIFKSLRSKVKFSKVWVKNAASAGNIAFAQIVLQQYRLIDSDAPGLDVEICGVFHLKDDLIDEMQLYYWNTEPVRELLLNQDAPAAACEFLRRVPFDAGDVSATDRAMRMLRETRAKVSGSTNINDFRTAFLSLTQQFPVNQGVTIEKSTVGSGVKGELITPKAGSPRGIILYIHGGGFGIGSPATVRAPVSELSVLANCCVFNVDYRLAPEDPYPAALEDCLQAYRALLKDWDPKQIVIGGDSAGGGLTASSLLAIRDAGQPLPAVGVCISPWVDLRCLGESYASRAHLDPFIFRESLLGAAAAYLGGKTPAEDPGVSPALGSFKGIPPLLVQIGEREVLFDDVYTFVKAAKEAGVDVRFEVWDGMFHEWHMFSSFLRPAQRALVSIADYVLRHLPR